MPRDISPSFGVTRTIIKNLTGTRLFLAWWPEKHGEGRSMAPHEKIRFNGNLFEALHAWPSLKNAMEADVRAGKVAVAYCGAETSADPYPVVKSQPVPGFAQYGCIDWEYDSSSSMWVEE
jgi:hypothetical protein